MELPKPLAFMMDALFPPRCLACGALLDRGERLCGPCRARIALFDAPFCGVCGARRPPGTRACHPGAPFPLFAAMSYQDPVPRALVHRLKYGRCPEAAAPLGLALFAAAARAGLYDIEAVRSGNAVIVPVPLHGRKFRERGFNQSALLARAFAGTAERCGMPRITVLERALRRLRPTPSQTECAGAEERRANVAGCFAVRDAAAVEGRDILLLDDVYTTGATMAEAARVLKQSGAKKVFALAAAKA